MLTASPKAEELLDIAERYIRTVGYSNFSFRDLAQAANIKSASVHYHYPTKEALALAVARRCARVALENLGDPDAPLLSAEQQLDKLYACFEQALTADGQVCPFGVLGAEYRVLPPALQAEVRQFFNACAGWLVSVFKRVPALAAADPALLHARANMVIAAIEGSLLIVRCAGDQVLLKSVLQEIKKSALTAP